LLCSVSSRDGNIGIIPAALSRAVGERGDRVQQIILADDALTVLH
jgi:hypothetical protein